MPLTKEQALRIALTKSLKKNEVYRKALAEILNELNIEEFISLRKIEEIVEKALNSKL